MKINNEKDYQKYLHEVDALMKKGEENLSKSELKRIGTLSASLEAYEDTVYPIIKPEGLIGMVEVKMFEKKMSQTDFAKASGISLPKINQIINGKRKADIPFAKAVHKILDIPADYILSHL
ncbi:helix-turn-helix domain-containing protein [Riemerella columbipharyngis]|uniref:HTH-type transcriptional regulator / antitoxin HigA n=1 Tax=Riemerella columbipharyngis TaxID=1071918 RepID=A0A1G7AJX2_9FLAO|nr:helix-turn-helix domain-containing protein [Riemerella columbipharyngis]SDE15224.1 HTH-type transcriptional regulator / antitoxin HigA [Riemerella columbipharyngis]